MADIEVSSYKIDYCYVDARDKDIVVEIADNCSIITFTKDDLLNMLKALEETNQWH